MRGKIENRLERIGLNTREENNIILYDCLTQGSIEKMISFIKKGYPVSAFILNVLVDLNYHNNYIDRVLTEAVHMRYDVYDFLVIYWGEDKTNQFFMKRNFEKIINSKFSNEALLKYGFIDKLLSRENGEKFYIMNAPLDEVLNNKKLYNFPTEFFIERLTSEEDMEKVYRDGKHINGLVHTKDGIRFLFNKHEYEILLKYVSCIELLAILNISSKNEFFEHMYEYYDHDSEKLYNNTVSRSISSSTFLLEKAKENPADAQLILKPLIDRGMYEHLCDYHFYDFVDWDAYYKRSKNLGICFEVDCEMSMIRAQRWDMLEKYGKSMELFRRKKFIRAIRALFK